jgi:hypothetical protein
LTETKKKIRVTYLLEFIGSDGAWS